MKIVDPTYANVVDVPIPLKEEETVDQSVQKVSTPFMPLIHKIVEPAASNMWIILSFDWFHRSTFLKHFMLNSQPRRCKWRNAMFIVVLISPRCCWRSQCGRRPCNPCTVESNYSKNLTSSACVWQRRPLSCVGLQRRILNGCGLQGPRAPSALCGVWN